MQTRIASSLAELAEKLNESFAFLVENVIAETNIAANNVLSALPPPRDRFIISTEQFLAVRMLQDLFSQLGSQHFLPSFHIIVRLWNFGRLSTRLVNLVRMASGFGHCELTSVERTTIAKVISQFVNMFFLFFYER